MGLLRPISVVATGGAAYYMASDGGDADVLRTRTLRLRDRVDKSLTNTLGEGTVETIRENFNKLTMLASPIFGREVADSAGHAAAVAVQAGDAGAGAGAGGIFCHDCSGSRIRYFAEKFGLWRREEAVAQAQAQAQEVVGNAVAQESSETAGKYTGPRAWYLDDHSRIKRRIAPDYDR